MNSHINEWIKEWMNEWRKYVAVFILCLELRDSFIEACEILQVKLFFSINHFKRLHALRFQDQQHTIMLYLYDGDDDDESLVFSLFSFLPT